MDHAWRSLGTERWAPVFVFLSVTAAPPGRNDGRRGAGRACGESRSVTPTPALPHPGGGSDQGLACEVSRGAAAPTLALPHPGGGSHTRQEINRTRAIHLFARVAPSPWMGEGWGGGGN